MIDAYELDLSAWEALLQTCGEPREAARARAREIWRGLYRDCITAFAQLPDLSAALRARLAAEVQLQIPATLAQQEAPDGATRKDLLELADGERIEVVLLRYRERRSACISTQVGCACGCEFCATGQAGFTRNLSAGEIVTQALHIQRELAALGQQLTNVVLMGMGEPLLNYAATLSAVRRLADPRGLALPPRRITLSTAGIPDGIRRLADENIPLRLAVSLHAATDAVRDLLMPINRRYPLAELGAALRTYAAQTGRRVFCEGVMIHELTDTPEQAAALVALVRGLDAHINLIALNATPDYARQPSTPAALATFAAALDAAGVPHTVRQRRGSAIAAGCGQLRQQRAT